MRKTILSILMGGALASGAAAQTFNEATVAVPVSSLENAKEWYGKFLGEGAEMIEPAPGVLEIKATPNMWLQLYETEQMPETGAVLRFLVDDMAESQSAYAAKGIDTGEAIEVPAIVTYSEFTDPFGNQLGLYDLP